MDRQVYEEVSEISHRITDGGLLLDEYYVLHEMLKKYKKGLNKNDLELFERLVADERFKGRRRLLKELSILLKDFSPYQKKFISSS